MVKLQVAKEGKLPFTKYILMQAAIEALETGLARRAAPTQTLQRALSDMRARMTKAAEAPSRQVMHPLVASWPSVKGSQNL